MKSRIKMKFSLVLSLIKPCYCTCVNIAIYVNTFNLSWFPNIMQCVYSFSKRSFFPIQISMMPYFIGPSHQGYYSKYKYFFLKKNPRSHVLWYPSRREKSSCFLLDRRILHSSLRGRRKQRTWLCIVLCMLTIYIPLMA